MFSEGFCNTIIATWQVEHYLSLGNLASDSFLRAHMSASASGASVPLSVICSFPRFRV